VPSLTVLIWPALPGPHPYIFFTWTFFVGDLFIYLFFETGFCYVPHAGPELSTVLRQSPECWDYSSTPP
jgi:hypothetical protein